MKKKWLKSLDGIDDQYVVEATPHPVTRAKRAGRTARRLGLIAACMVFVILAGSVILFTPYKTTPPSVEKYADSEYYSLIQKLNVANYQPPRNKNNAQAILDILENLLFVGKTEDAVTNGALIDGQYQEVTDNQVEGVIEADRIKRSDSHIYYLANNSLYIYSIEAKDSKPVAVYTVQSDNNIESFVNEWEFFLSKDCKTVTVLAPYLFSQGNDHREHYLEIITLDVSDPAKITKQTSVSVSGQYLSSRLTEHGLLVMTKMTCNTTKFDKEWRFVPQIITKDGTRSMPPESIMAPDKLTNSSYTIMLLMDDVGATIKDSGAYLSYSDKVYVSADNIYLTRRFTELGPAMDGRQPYTTVSEISCLGYGTDGFTPKGSVIVDGYVLDQYSMDQYENTLRVFTTTEKGTRQVHYNHANFDTSLAISRSNNTSANLYVVDLTTMQITASVKQFAPVGETVRSARFEGNTAYVCTAVQQTDPVFFFDLTDLNDIKVKQTGTIEGFSTSLVNFGDGYLLGIGQGGSPDILKLEVYTESETGVRTHCKLEMPYTTYCPDYKCYYIDRENGLIGLGIYTWDVYWTDEYRTYRYENFRFDYIVLHFDGKSISEVMRIEYGKGGNLLSMRGVYIDGYYYTFHEHQYNVNELPLE